MKSESFDEKANQFLGELRKVKRKKNKTKIFFVVKTRYPFLRLLCVDCESRGEGCDNKRKIEDNLINCNMQYKRGASVL